MANTKSAKKAIRVSERKKAMNSKSKTGYKEAQKKLAKAISSKEKKQSTLELLSKAYKAIDKAAKRNVIHKKKAARLKSRLAKSSK